MNKSMFENVSKYLTSNIKNSEKADSKATLLEITKKYGPVVEGYPSWHPFVSGSKPRSPEFTPCVECGFEGLDHTVYFLNAFITCPYGDGQEVINSVKNFPRSRLGWFRAKRLDVELYSSSTSITPILVYFEWLLDVDPAKPIPPNIAIPLFLQHELPCWEWAQYAETWDDMSPHFLGLPQGKRSSLFVSNATVMSMKKIYTELNRKEVFGPKRSDEF